MPNEAQNDGVSMGNSLLINVAYATGETMGTTKKVFALKQFIGRDWIDSSSGETFEDLNPLDDSVYATVAKGTGNDMRAAVKAARGVSSDKNTTPTHDFSWC